MKKRMRKKTPGELIKLFRLRYGMTPEAMADFLGTSRTELSNFENDRRQISKQKRLYWSSLVPEWTPDMLYLDETDLKPRAPHKTTSS